MAHKNNQGFGDDESHNIEDVDPARKLDGRTDLRVGIG
jgi:hypothetical protein